MFVNIEIISVVLMGSIDSNEPVRNQARDLSLAKSGKYFVSIFYKKSYIVYIMIWICCAIFYYKIIAAAD